MGFAESLSDQRLLTLYAYWSAKRGQRAMPSRADIDPGDFRTLLPHILLVDVVGGGTEFRYRLVGTEIEHNIGRTVTGRLFGEVLSGDYLAYIQALHRRVIAEAAPIYAENNINERHGAFTAITDFKRTYRLMLPLSRDGTAVDMLLGVQLFKPIRNRDEPEILLVDKA